MHASAKLPDLKSSFPRNLARATSLTLLRTDVTSVFVGSSCFAFSDAATAVSNLCIKKNKLIKIDIIIKKFHDPSQNLVS